MNTSALIEVGTYNFEQEVEKCDRPVVVLIHSDGCLACKEFRVTVEQAAITHSKHFKFCILEAKRSPELAFDIANGVYPASGIYYNGDLIMTFNVTPSLEFYQGFLNRQVTTINRRKYLESKKSSTASQQ